MDHLERSSHSGEQNPDYIQVSKTKKKKDIFSQTVSSVIPPEIAGALKKTASLANSSFKASSSPTKALKAAVKSNRAVQWIKEQHTGSKSKNVNQPAAKFPSQPTIRRENFSLNQPNIEKKPDVRPEIKSSSEETSERSQVSKRVPAWAVNPKPTSLVDHNIVQLLINEESSFEASSSAQLISSYDMSRQPEIPQTKSTDDKELKNKTVEVSKNEIPTETPQIRPSQRDINRLSASVVKAVMPQLNEISLDAMPRPTDGLSAGRMRFANVKVRDNDLPLVIRLYANKGTEDLLEKRHLAYQLIEENHFQHLKVPQSRMLVTERFLIEERLPSLKNGRVSNPLFYNDNHALFDEAALEFTEFLTKINLRDIINPATDWNYIDVWGNNRNFFAPRYDNILIYKGEDGKGKVGLIDLDYLKEIKETDKVDYFYAATVSTTFFPHQFEASMKLLEGKLKDSEIQQLEAMRDNALNALKILGDNPFKEVSPLAVHDRLKAIDIDLLKERVVKETLETGVWNYAKEVEEWKNENEIREDFDKKLEQLISMFKVDESLSEYEITAERNLAVSFKEGILVRIAKHLTTMGVLGDAPTPGSNTLNLRYFYF